MKNLLLWIKLLTETEHHCTHHVFWQGLSNFRVDEFDQGQPWKKEYFIDF